MKEFKLVVTYCNKKGIKSSRHYEFDNWGNAKKKFQQWESLLEADKAVGNITTFEIVIYRVQKYWSVKE